MASGRGLPPNWQPTTQSHSLVAPPPAVSVPDVRVQPCLHIYVSVLPNLYSHILLSCIMWQPQGWPFEYAPYPERCHLYLISCFMPKCTMVILLTFSLFLCCSSASIQSLSISEQCICDATFRYKGNASIKWFKNVSTCIHISNITHRNDLQKSFVYGCLH